MRIWIHALLAFTLCLAALPATALPTAAGYNVSTIDAGAVTTGGVVVVGGTLFVGTGGFGAPQSIVRIDSNGDITTLATDFGSISGLTYDPINDRLIVGDNFANAGSLGGALTSDNLYGIPDPLNQTGTPLTALGLELLPTTLPLPGVADVVLDPRDATGQTLFVTDSSEGFPPNGLLLSVHTGTQTVTVLESGLGYTAGVAATTTETFYGELEPAFFTGQITARNHVTGPPSGLISGMAGQADLLLASDGNLLATSSAFGGASELLRIDPVSGVILETLATDFAFATGIAENAGEVYVIEGSTGFAQVLHLVPAPEPGTGLVVGLGLLVLARRRA